MSAISNDPAKLKSSALNTTINAEILAAFRMRCKQQGVPMNTIIEAFMRQYLKGGFYLKFGRESGMVEVEIDESEIDKPVADTATTDTRGYDQINGTEYFSRVLCFDFLESRGINHSI